MGMTAEERDNPTWVEKQDIRFYYLERADPTLTQMSRVEGVISDLEIAVFNDWAQARGSLLLLTITSGPSANGPEGVVCLNSTGPVTRASTAALLDRFLLARRLLTKPSEEDALYLLGHDDIKVRRYARTSWFRWLSRWTKESMDDELNEIDTPEVKELA